MEVYKSSIIAFGSSLHIGTTNRSEQIGKGYFVASFVRVLGDSEQYRDIDLEQCKIIGEDIDTNPYKAIDGKEGVSIFFIEKDGGDIPVSKVIANKDNTFDFYFIDKNGNYMHMVTTYKFKKSDIELLMCYN